MSGYSGEILSADAADFWKREEIHFAFRLFLSTLLIRLYYVTQKLPTPTRMKVDFFSSSRGQVSSRCNDVICVYNDGQNVCKRQVPIRLASPRIIFCQSWFRWPIFRKVLNFNGQVVSSEIYGYHLQNVVYIPCSVPRPSFRYPLRKALKKK